MAERRALYLAIAVLVAIVVAVKIVSVEVLREEPVLLAYGLVTSGYILSRYALAWCYVPQPPQLSPTGLPSVALIVPAYNEQDEIAATVTACLDVDYPAHLLRVVVVDDCSTDDTLARVRELQRTRESLVVVPQPENRGKRHAMATGIDFAGEAEVLVFIDSDSRLEPESVATMMRYFADESVGAVTGHTDVLNRNTNVLTRMQAVRYFVAFRVHKSAEALFGSVTCCSGCFSAYRRTAVDPVLEEWRNQTFLGEPATFGDDRSLTNLMLQKWKVLYAPDAYAHTNVPDDIKTFLRQQLRWKKSWTRESLRACRFMWRKNPIMSVSFLLGFVLPLLGPLVVARVVWHLFALDPVAPVWFLGGVVVMALMYGLYFRVHRPERIWAYSILFSLLYASVFVWQMPYAILTIRNSKWGTR
ncbi:glycosyltransferase family 2 protein [Rhodococcus sp. X156]|uniref:glycosyltransferase family 2 protein n=1 Tax=Rhodococcus sp. X156 TaxID=2499145 RepID=UPI001F49C439|nr:glycosyltransferase family 2 protein [Rhodococcus sp. X156]